MLARPFRFRQIFARRAGAAALAVLFGMAATMPAMAIDARRPSADIIPIRAEVTAPPGAQGICAMYDWACAKTNRTILVDDALMQTVRAVNSRANRSIRPISDFNQYRVMERWSLPTARGGDCEDYALYKKRELIRAGIPAEQLLIAVVLDRKRQPHAVLILRTGTQDLVLDNMNSRILPWQKTGYTFLRLQNPRQPSGWVSVMAGGMLPNS